MTPRTAGMPTALLYLCSLFAAAIWLKSALTPLLTYPYIKVDTGLGVSFTVLNYGMPDKRQCEQHVTQIARAVQSTCPICKISESSCNANLSEDEYEWLSDRPSEIPLARSMEGVIAFHASVPELAQDACLLSQGKSTGGGLRCFAPGLERPYPADQQNRIDSADKNFSAVLFFTLGSGTVIIAFFLSAKRRLDELGVSKPITALETTASPENQCMPTRKNMSRGGYRWVKRGADLILATLLLILTSPVFLVLSMHIRRDGGKVLYGHTRVGRYGKPFRCLKFRTMCQDGDLVLQQLLARDPVARGEWEKDFKLRSDPRITRVGHFLRRTSLDELPQLINVIRGEMSLVGPRPIVTSELERYGDYANLYLQVWPGMTGLWQVSGRNDTGYGRRVELDSWYVQNWSLWCDILILIKTVGAVLQRRGAY